MIFATVLLQTIIWPSFVKYTVYTCIYLYITSNISVQCCVRHNHPKWIYMQINFNKTYSVLFLQLGIPLIFVPSISQPSVSTHQQYPVEGWHCTSSKLPSSLHCGIYRPGIGVPEIWVKKFQNLTKVNTRGCKWVTAPKKADQYSKFNDYPFYSTVLELNLAAVKSPHPWPSFLPSFLQLILHLLNNSFKQSLINHIRHKVNNSQISLRQAETKIIGTFSICLSYRGVHLVGS